MDISLEQWLLLVILLLVPLLYVVYRIYRYATKDWEF